jgi:hypothetical protein
MSVVMSYSAAPVGLSYGSSQCNGVVVTIVSIAAVFASEPGTHTVDWATANRRLQY